MARKKNEKLVASIAAFREDGKLLFGLRADNHRYSLPGGHLEEGEEHLKAAVRELLEETGLKPTALKYLGHGLVRKTRGNVRVFCYEARVEGEPSGKNDPDKEFGVFRWVDPKDIPADVSENLHSRNNVTLRLLDLQEGEVRKFEDELPDLSKEESNGDISKPPLFLEEMPKEEWLKLAPEERYKLTEAFAKRMAHPPASMGHLLSQETWDQLPPELRLRYETLADHAKQFDRPVETTTFPPNTPEEKEGTPQGSSISPDDWQHGLWAKYLRQHPNIDVPAPGSEDGWQAHSPEERHHKWESYHAGVEGGYLQDEHRRWQLHDDPIKADPIESMLVHMPPTADQDQHHTFRADPREPDACSVCFSAKNRHPPAGPTIADEMMALKLPGVTRRHVQIALDSEHGKVRQEVALKHPLVDKRHLKYIIEQPRNPIANGNPAQQYRGKALDISEALSHPLMDDSLLDSCVKAYQHIPAEAANSPNTLNWVHKFAEHPSVTGDMIARCLDRSTYKEGQTRNDWGHWLHSMVLVNHPKLPQGWIADRIKDWDAHGDDQWSSSKRAKAQWAQVMLGHPNVPAESLELVGKEGRKLLRQEPGGAYDAMTRVPLEQLAKAKNLPSNEITEWARALKPYDDRNVTTQLQKLLSNPNTDSKALDQVVSKPDCAAFVGRHPAATDTQLSRCFDTMTDSMGVQGYDFRRQAQDLTDLLNNPRTPTKVLDRAVKLATTPGTNPGTVMSTARCTRLSDDQYSALISSRMPEVSDGLEKNPALSAEHLKQMASSPDSAMVHAALQRPYTVPGARAPLTADDIETAMKSPDVKVRLAAVDNPVTTPDQLLRALKDPTSFPWTVSRADGQGLAPTLHNPLKTQGGNRFNAPPLGMATVVSADDQGRPNKNIGPDHVTALLQHPDPMAQARGASDPRIDPKMLQLLVDTNERLAPAVASNPSLNAVQQLSLAQKASGSVLQALNNNPSLSPETIRHLHTNHQLSNWDHPNIPEDVIHDELVSGEDERVRHQALRHPNLGSSTVDELKRQFANRRLQHEGGGLMPPPIWSKRVARPWSEATLPLRQSVWDVQTREDREYEGLIHSLTADAHPDYQFKESTQVRPGMQKLRKLRDIIKDREPTAQVAHPKDLPPGDWSAGRLPDGRISAQKIDEAIKAVKPVKYNLSSTRYGSAQLHNGQPSKVLQVNLSSDHVKQMRQHGVYDTFKAMNDASMQSEHPVLPQTLGWIRYTGDSRNGYFIDEIQSDFGQSFVKQAAAQAQEQGQDPNKAAAEAQKRWPEEHYNIIKKILFGGKHPNEILHEAFLQHLRDKGFGKSKVQIHSVESKAPISLGKKLPVKCGTCGVIEADHPDGPGTNRAALKHPFVPDPADGGEHIWCAHPGCGGKLSSPNHTPAADHNFVAGPADRLKAPAHMNVTYHDVPKKMGYEPSSYGKLKTQNGTWDENDIGEGAPTWEGKVRKTEPGDSIPGEGQVVPWEQAHRYETHVVLGGDDHGFAPEAAEAMKVHPSWRHGHVPIEHFVPSVASKAIADRYAHMPAETAPAAIGMPRPDGKLDLLDGNHRVAAARARGDKTVLAFVPSTWQPPGITKTSPLAKMALIHDDAKKPSDWATMYDYSKPGEVNPWADQFAAGEHLRKTEPLAKMALKAIPRGAKQSPDTDLDPRAKSWKYDHVLQPAHVAEGYGMNVHHYPTGGGYAHGPVLVAELTHHGDSAGQVFGRIGNNQIAPHAEMFDSSHKGKGLGTAMYEALLAHAHHMGIQQVAGGPHSEDANRVHQSLARKHGIAPPSDTTHGYRYTIKSEAGFRNKVTGAVHRTGSTHDLLQLPEGIDTNPEEYEDGFMIDGEFVPREEAVVHDAPHASDKVRKDEHLIWLAGLPLNKMAMIPKDLSPVARYHDPVAHTFVDDSNEEQANPAEHDHLKAMFKQHVIDDPQDVKRGRTGTRESSNSTGKVVYDIKSDVNKWPKASVDRFMVKPYHEKVVPRARHWVQHPIQGWAEMTNQALYHAGGIGDLHQRVHVARVPLEIKGPKTRNNTTAWHNEFWTPEMKQHQLDSIISGPAYGSKYSRNELAGMYSDFLAAKQAEVAKTQAKLPKDRQETAPALVLHMQPQVSTIYDMQNYEFKPDVQAQARQIGLMDFLTNNLDRHSTNLLYDHVNQKLLAIDHSRSFQYKNSDKRPLPKMATPYDSLHNYLKDTAIGHLLPQPDRLSVDPKTGAYTRDDVRYHDALDAWADAWDVTLAWWKKHSEPIKAQMSKRLELIRDNTVREHVRTNFMRRTRMLDDWAKHGVRNFGGADFLNNELPITKPGEAEPD